MLASIARIRLRQTSPHQLHRSFSSSPVSNYVKLAYDLHKPAKDTDEASTRNAPVIFIHGLFGSKKNNRSMRPPQPWRLGARFQTRLYGAGRGRRRLHRRARPRKADAHRPLHVRPQQKHTPLQRHKATS
ncbi:hypothetical protein LTR39_006434 [Cryomyces antarcticus]|nr:hypothetical protein LTR39_006434 [Cryomyces antarcticus]